MQRNLFGLFFAVILLTGCGASAPEAEVSGLVKVDGQPLKEGDILFEAADGLTTPGAGKIVEGKYTVKLIAGSKKVKISATRPAKKVDPTMGAAAREPMIAKEFNDQTTLTAEIKPGKQDGVNFDVKAIP